METSVISYLAALPSRDLIAAARQQLTREWWDRRRPGFALFVSQLVVDEAVGGDPDAARRREALLADIPMLDVSQDAVGLARFLVSEAGLPKQAAPMPCTSRSQPAMACTTC